MILLQQIKTTDGGCRLMPIGRALADGTKNCTTLLAARFEPLIQAMLIAVFSINHPITGRVNLMT